MTQGFCALLLHLGRDGGFNGGADCMTGAGPGFDVPFFVCKSE